MLLKKEFLLLETTCIPQITHEKSLIAVLIVRLKLGDLRLTAHGVREPNFFINEI